MLVGEGEPLSAYYNEIDPQKAACLREFIKANRTNVELK
jgi:hypothetical protein